MNNINEEFINEKSNLIKLMTLMISKCMKFEKDYEKV